MQTDKKLYLLHIPRTGVRFVNQIIRGYITPQLRSWPSKQHETDGDLNNFSYLHGHFGNYPINVVNNLSVACIFRNPIERAAGNFTYIYDKILKDKYSHIDNLADQLREYLFNDQDYAKHNNIHARFLLSGTDHEIEHILSMSSKTPYDSRSNEELEADRLEYIERSKNWYLPDTEISLDSAKNIVDSIEILGIHEDIDSFIDKCLNWFYVNHGIDKTLPPGVHINNTMSFLTYTDGKMYKTQDVYQLLSQSDIDLYNQNNQIDYDLYNYVKNKLS